LQISGQTVYLATERAGIYILDGSDPTQLSQLGYIHPNSVIFYNLQVAGDRLYAMSYRNGLYIYDVSNPGQVQLVQNNAYGGSHGNYAYAGNNSGYIAIFDLAHGTYVNDLLATRDGLHIINSGGSNGELLYDFMPPATPAWGCWMEARAD